jgi:hypothetical protein
MPELARLEGGDLITSPLLAWSSWVAEPGFGGCEVPPRGPTGVALRFGRLVNMVGLALGCGGVDCLWLRGFWLDVGERAGSLGGLD